jgi:hypothetical protein
MTDSYNSYRSQIVSKRAWWGWVSQATREIDAGFKKGRWILGRTAWKHEEEK